MFSLYGGETMAGEPMAVDYYIPLIVFLFMGAIVPIAALAAVKIISPLKPSRRKLATTKVDFHQSAMPGFSTAYIPTSSQ
jgi:NADH:ubiquinone oxidoreductase subunit 3 (subunit A)